MVDPTVKKKCPACGYHADVNQMGQMYSHSGVNGCPYTGSGPLKRQGIYPLKFAGRPLTTVGAAHATGGLGATIRYDLGPREKPSVSDYLSIQSVDGDPVGIAEVKDMATGTLTDMFMEVRDSKARYGLERSSHLVDKMNDYYDDDIDHGTEVTALFYKPNVTYSYRDGPNPGV